MECWNTGVMFGPEPNTPPLITPLLQLGIGYEFTINHLARSHSADRAQVGRHRRCVAAWSRCQLGAGAARQSGHPQSQILRFRGTHRRGQSQIQRSDGGPCYPDIASIPEPVNAWSAVPNRHVPDLLESAANAGVRAAVVLPRVSAKLAAKAKFAKLVSKIVKERGFLDLRPSVTAC